MTKSKSQLKWLATTITIVSLISLLLSFWLLSKQMNILVETIILVVFVFFFNFFLFSKREMNNVNVIIWLFGSFYLIIKQFLNFRHYRFFSGVFTPFWIIPLIIGVSTGVVTVIAIWKNSKLWGKLGYFILVAFVITALLSAIITNLNYALNFSEPTKTIVTIEDKNIDFGRKSPTTYKFAFTQNDKKHYIQVPYSDYCKYNIGNIYELAIYEGAFGEKFYMSTKY